MCPQGQVSELARVPVLPTRPPISTNTSTYSPHLGHFTSVSQGVPLPSWHPLISIILTLHTSLNPQFHFFQKRCLRFPAASSGLLYRQRRSVPPPDLCCLPHDDRDTGTDPGSRGECCRLSVHNACCPGTRQSHSRWLPFLLELFLGMHKLFLS